MGGMSKRVSSPPQRLVTDELWSVLEPLIPSRPAAKGPGGRPRASDRAALEGILFVLSTGCRWRDLQPQMGFGSGVTCWRRLRHWQEAGVWERLHHLILDELGQLGAIDWERHCIDAVSVRAKKGGRTCRPQPGGSREERIEVPPVDRLPRHPVGSDPLSWQHP